MLKPYLKCVVLLWQAGCFVLLANKIKPLVSSKENHNSIQPITWNCVAHLTAIRDWKYLQSRGYPNRLIIRESRCSWRITTTRGNRIRLAFRKIDFPEEDQAHCSSNYIEIIDETLKATQARFCGKLVPGDIVSQGNKIRIDFQAEAGVYKKNKGFSIGYKKTKDEPGFHNVQSLLPKKRRPSFTPPPPPILRNDNDKRRKETANKSNSVPMGTIIGAFVGCLAVVTIVVMLVWKKQKASKKKKSKKEKKLDPVSSKETRSSNSQKTEYPFQQVSPRYIPRQTSVIKDSSYVNVSAPSWSRRNKPLPEIPQDSTNFGGRAPSTRHRTFSDSPVSSQVNASRSSHSNFQLEPYKSKHNEIPARREAYLNHRRAPPSYRSVVEKRNAEKENRLSLPGLENASRSASRSRTNLHQMNDTSSQLERFSQFSSISPPERWRSEDDKQDQWHGYRNSRISSKSRNRFDSTNNHEAAVRDHGRYPRQRCRSISNMTDIQKSTDRENSFFDQTNSRPFSRNILRASAGSRFQSYEKQNGDQRGHSSNIRSNLGYRTTSRVSRYPDAERNDRRFNHFSSERFGFDTNDRVSDVARLPSSKQWSVS